MKKVMMACCVMLMTSVLLPSCLGDDDDVTYYDNVSITSFTPRHAEPLPDSNGGRRL